MFRTFSVVKYAIKYPLATIADVSILLPIAFTLSQRLNSTALRFFCGFLYWTLFRNIVNIWTASEKMNNLPLFNLDLIVRFTLLAAMFYHTFPYPHEKRIVLILIISFAILFGVDFFLSNPNLNDWHNHRINRYSFVVEGVLMLGLVLRFFLYLIRELPVVSITQYPMFWISCGLLIAHAGTIFLTPFLYYFNVWNNPYNFRTMVRIEHWVEIIRNVAFAIAMFHARRSTH